jgi:uncharacterized protein
MSRVVHFEILADDLDRADKFYTCVFDWDIKKWDGPFDYRPIMTGKKEEPDIDGELRKRQDSLAAKGGFESDVCMVGISVLMMP